MGASSPQPAPRAGALGRRRRTIAGVALPILLLVLLGAVRLSGSDAREPPPVRLRADRLSVNFAGRPAPPFRLRDARGGVLSTRALRGRPFALTFLYSHCTDTCPMIGAELQRALALLGPQARRTNVVAITVDPRGDTAAAVRRWLRRMREPADFHYLSGSEPQLLSIWDRYFVDPQTGGPDDAHSSVIYLVDRRGTMRGVFQARLPVDPRNIAHDLRLLIAGSPAPAAGPAS